LPDQEIRFNLYNSLLLVIVMAVLILTPLARGGVHLWAKSMIWVLSSGALAVMMAKSIREKAPVFPKTPLSSGLWGLLLLLGISTLMSDHRGLGLEGFILFFCYVVLFHAVVIVTNSRRFERGVVNVIVGSGFFVAIVGLLKWAGANPFFWWDYPEMAGYKEDFATGIFVNPNHFAGFLGMVLPLAIVYFFTGPRALEQKFISWSIVTVMVAGLALSISTGGWAAAMGGLIFLFVILAFGRMFNRKRTVVTILICAIIAVGGLLSATPAVDMVAEKTGTYPHESMAARKRIWTGTMSMIEDHILTGTGPGSFARVYPRFQVPGMPVLSRQAHSDFLQFISETGVVCVPLILFLLYRFFFNGIKALHSPSRQRRGIQLGAMAGVVVMLIFGIYYFNLYVPANAVYLCVLAGLGTETGY